MKYKAVYAMTDLGTFDDMKSAFKVIYDKMKAERTALMAFDATWVELVDVPLSYIGSRYRSFYDVRDHACDMGWVKDGKWVEEVNHG